MLAHPRRALEMIATRSVSERRNLLPRLRFGLPWSSRRIFSFRWRTVQRGTRVADENHWLFVNKCL